MAYQLIVSRVGYARLIKMTTLMSNIKFSSSGSIREAGGAWAERQKAKEDEYFYKQQKEQFKRLKEDSKRKIKHHRDQIEKHEEAIRKEEEKLKDKQG